MDFFRSSNDTNDAKTLGLVILFGVLFFIFILPLLNNKTKEESDKVKESLTNTNETRKIDMNRCSKQCCNHSQWPVPHDALTNEMSLNESEQYIGSNLSCNFGSGSGCVCFTKDDFNYLANRGSNSTNNTCSN
jgi:hypothetical protein